MGSGQGRQESFWNAVSGGLEEGRERLVGKASDMALGKVRLLPPT